MHPVCEGNGDDPQKRASAEAWRPTEPPKGEGFQLWETLSEGSPVSPVFKTADELATWCADNATTFADFKATKEECHATCGKLAGLEMGSVAKADPEKIEAAIDMLDAIHALARSADRATNIGERVIFLATSHIESLN